MPSYYGSVSDAEDYFTRRLGSQVWDDSLAGDRVKALYMATAAIDKLNFAGDVAETDQELQFPRGNDTEVPDDVEQATYEEAFALLDGIDVNEEARAVGVLSESMSGVRTTYDDAYAPENVVAGIASVEAWRMLRPYLRDNRSINLCRGS